MFGFRPLVMIPSLLYLVVVCHASCLAADVREWTDSTGRFKIQGEFFAANPSTVVIKKKRDGALVAMEIDKLSSGDQTYVRDHLAELESTKAGASTDLQSFQTWTTKEGFELRGKVVAFGSRDVEITRTAGKVVVNGTAFSKLDAYYQHVVLKIVAQYAAPNVKTERDLEQWLRSNQGNVKPIHVDGVKLQLEDGSDLLVPFFLFSEQDLAVLQPGYQSWQQEKASQQERDREDFLMQVQANRYQQEKEATVRNQQIQMMALDLLAINAGVYSVWEVMLAPAVGYSVRPVSVVVNAVDSTQAQQMALSRYPNFSVVGVRRLSN